MICVCKDGKRKYKSLGVSVKAEHWNFEKNLPKTNCPNKEYIQLLQDENRRGYMLSIKQVYNSLVKCNKHLDIYFTNIDVAWLRSNKLEENTIGIRFRTETAKRALSKEDINKILQDLYPSIKEIATSLCMNAIIATEKSYLCRYNRIKIC